MDLFAHLSLGLETVFQPVNLLFCFLGVFLGTAIGVLPGIGPLGTIAILLPVTFSFPPEASLIMLAGIFYGAQYGGPNFGEPSPASMPVRKGGLHRRLLAPLMLGVGASSEEEPSALNVAIRAASQQRKSSRTIACCRRPPPSHAPHTLRAFAV